MNRTIINLKDSIIHYMNEAIDQLSGVSETNDIKSMLTDLVYKTRQWQADVRVIQRFEAVDRKYIPSQPRSDCAISAEHISEDALRGRRFIFSYSSSTVTLCEPETGLPIIIFSPAKVKYDGGIVYVSCNSMCYSFCYNGNEAYKYRTCKIIWSTPQVGSNYEIRFSEDDTEAYIPRSPFPEDIDKYPVIQKTENTLKLVGRNDFEEYVFEYYGNNFWNFDHINYLSVES